MLFVVRRLQELGQERKVSMYKRFIDPQQAYDSVDRQLLRKVLTRFGVQAKMLAVIRQFHNGMPARVRTDADEHSQWFDVTQGLRQRRSTVAVTVQRVLRCCDTRHPSTVQRGRRHREGIDSPLGCGGRKRGAIAMRAKVGVGHVVRR